MKLHLQDIRLKNNAGIDFPVCKRNEKCIDMEATRYPTINTDQYRKMIDKSKVCKHCVRAWAKLYDDWAPLER
jgi:hypothetical protein